MRILIACEASGVVRRAFRAKGHDAYSCDVPAEDGETVWHFQDDVLNRLTWAHWDLLIAHPPCTYLANSGVKWLYLAGRRENGVDPARWQALAEGADFYLKLYRAPIARKCIENPVMHGHAARLIGHRATQFVQPWQFGHGEIKATGLDLVGLPKLKPTNIVAGRVPRVHFASPSPDRWKDRSRTLTGIAEAMADQWGAL